MNNFIVLHSTRGKEIIINPAFIVEITEEVYQDSVYKTHIYYRNGSSWVEESVCEIKKMLIKNDSNIE